MQLEPAIRNDLIELIAASFKAAEVNELGRLIFRCFDSNEAAGQSANISLSARRSAGILVEQCEQGGVTDSLVKLVVELDDSVFHGRPVRVQGLEDFLGKLLRTGILYDFKTRKLVSTRRDPLDLANWGCLKDGREYDLTVISLDIAGTRPACARSARETSRSCTRASGSFCGKSWLPWTADLVVGRDGGIIAFAFRDHVARAVRFAVEVQATVPVFNLTESRSSSADIALRLGLDCGRMKFSLEPGRIVSDVINYAAHLEKKSTSAGMVSISRAVYDALPERLASVFRFGGIFEEKDYFTTIRRLDSLFVEEPEDAIKRLA